MTLRGTLNFAALGPKGQNHIERLQPPWWQVGPMGTGRGKAGREGHQTSPSPQQKRRFMHSNAAADAFPLSCTAPWSLQGFLLLQLWQALFSCWWECDYE